MFNRSVTILFRRQLYIAKINQEDRQLMFDEHEHSVIPEIDENHDRVIIHIGIDCFYAQVETL